MAQIPNLENAPINLLSLREQSQKELLAILRNIRGKKLLVIDQKLSGSLALIIQTSVLKENGVENLRHLSEDPIQTECKHIVYLVRSQIDLMRLVSSNIQSDNRQGLQREYHLFFVPRRTVACEKILQEEKVHQCLNIGEFPLYMIPLEEDVLSFELDMSLKENLVDGDSSSLWHVANGIHKLEASFGAIPYIRWKGKAAAKVKDILEHMQIEQPVTSADLGTPEINTLILLDREVDMVTPMCTQLTYEGLLDELLQVTNGAVELDASIMSVQQSAKKVKVPLNSNDKLYKEVRDLNFEVVVQVLRQKATSMKQDYTEVTTTSQTVAELKDFVKKLNSLPEMTRHINLAQHLTTFTTKPSFLSQLDIEHTLVEGQGYEICADYIEEMIHKQEPVLNVLRLLVLYSLSSSGLPKKQFDYFRREILHSYGFEHMSTLNNLERAGLFKKQEIKSNWLTIKRALQLVPDETDTSNPNDISYVFSGYAPLSVRLVQHAIKYGWRAMEETLKLLPGPHDEIKRDFYSNVPSFDSRQGAPQDKLTDGRRSVVLVVFIGGITFAEIAALRFLSSQEGMAYEVIIGTTKVINGNKLLDGFIDIHVEGPKKINGKT